MINILYLFGGEKAQGAEIVIERLMLENKDNYNTHLLLAPGNYADGLLNANKGFSVSTIKELKKLNRSSTGTLKYLAIALRNYVRIPIKVHRYMAKHNIQVVHANTIVPSSYLTLLILYTRIFKPSVRWIWTDHDMRYFTPLEKFLARLCSTIYDRTLVVSNAVARKYNNNHKKIQVLYNGLDLNAFKPDEKARRAFRKLHNIEDDEQVIGIAAVIHEDKGQLQLINAFKLLLANHNRKLKLILAGNFASQTPEYAELVQAAIQGQKAIKHLGFLESMSDFYNGCDLIVSNTTSFRSESLGTTIYEAMACEKIVVASNTGGSPEIITDNYDGFLFDPDDMIDLKCRMLTTLQHAERINQVRINARRKVADRFNLKTMAKNYRKIIDELIPTN